MTHDRMMVRTVYAYVPGIHVLRVCYMHTSVERFAVHGTCTSGTSTGVQAPHVSYMYVYTTIHILSSFFKTV